jgi:signal transduction histidine kinase
MERELSSDAALRALNGLLLAIWVAATVGWIFFENRRYDMRAADLRTEQQLRAHEAIEDTRRDIQEVARLLRGNRLVAEGLVVEDVNKLLDVTMPMLNLPHVQLVSLYKPSGDILVRANDPAVFGRTDQLSPWLAGMSQREETTVARVGARVYMLQAQRVEDLNGLIGYVVVGTELEKTFSDAIAMATAVPTLLLFRGEPVLTGTIVPEDATLVPVDIDPALTSAGLEVQLVNPEGDLRHAHGQNMVLGLAVLVVAGIFMMTVAGISSQALSRSQQRLVHARDEAERALQRQNELTELRSRFIAMTSHEFRTPLATILSSAQLLQHYKDRLPAEERDEVLASIASGVERMTLMLDKVLHISKAEAGMLDFEPQPIDLKALCEGVVQDVRRQWPASTCHVVTDLRLGEREGLYDEKLLRHVFENLLSNAIKYSPAGGEVRFEARRENGRMLFAVSDQGIGIPPEEQADLFESFHRASNVGDIPGTGLGLAIVKNSVERHGGEIEVASRPGQGTCFTVRI